MNVWKPIAITAVTLLVVSAGTQIASAEGVCRGQPHMQAALDHFRAARAELDKAEHNKGGWRERAVVAADTAIGETKRGCEVADAH